MKTHLNPFSPFASASAITIDALHLKPSQGFKTIAVAALIIAILYGTSMPLSLPGLCALTYLGVIAFAFWWQQTRTIHTVRKEANGLFVLESNKKMWQNMELLDESLSTPLACVLYFRSRAGGRTQNVVVWRDSVPADVYRRLRGWLHWCAS